MNRVLVDGSAAFDQRAGVGRYSRNILDRLIPAMPEIDWTLFHAPAGASDEWKSPSGGRVVRYPLNRHRFDQLGVRLGLPLPVRPFTGRQDLVYSPDFVAPQLRNAARIVTVHDIAFLTHPHLTTSGNVAFLTASVRRELTRGASFAAVSETTRDRLIDAFGIAGERVRVVRNGVDRRFFDPTPLSEAKRQLLGLPDAFLLMVGTIEPRKNHLTVLRAAERSPTGLPLVVVGREGWGAGAVVDQLKALRARGRVIWLDDFPDRDLPALYATSRGVLYPSWTEGFGLPVLEALAAGKPIVTGTDPVFAEIGGSFVTSVDPADEDAVLTAIRVLEAGPVSDTEADARRRHAAHYDWDQPVRILRDWIQQVSGDRR
jgi:alpha-1,3-rhamnosyl/mannosyltransferase